MTESWYQRPLRVYPVKIGKSALNTMLRAAKSASINSDYERTKLGAVIFYKNKILASGWNTKKSNPMQTTYNVIKHNPHLANSAHAEVNTLLAYARTQLGKNKSQFPPPSKLSILIYRQDRNGNPVLARPCNSCYMAIRDFGIKNIYYTGNGSIIHEMII